MLRMELVRNDLSRLSRWWDTPLRKTPCVLFGARQTGKSTLATKFASSLGREVLNINFWKDRDSRYKKIFQNKTSAKDVISDIEITLNKKLIPQETILLLDEIQECPAAYSLCKSLKEDTDLPVIATGSYLKLFLKALSKKEGGLDFEVPVGCTHELTITPLSFSEYLLNRSSFLYEKYKALPLDQKIDNLIHEQLLKAYYEYLFTGGLPEVVSNFLSLQESDLPTAIEVTREIQNNLIKGYKNDFLSFSNKQLIRGNVAERLSYTFDTVSHELYRYQELDRPVQRFTFSSLGKNSEYRRVSHIFEYLTSAGLIIPSYVIGKPGIPRAGHTSSKNAFKCFYFDTGILNAKLDIEYKAIIENRWNSYKGSIAENFVAQQLYHKTNQSLLSWKTKNYELEFLLEQDSEMIPIEVKASKLPSSSPSLNNYIKNFSPSAAYKVAPKNFGKNSGFNSIPIYLVEKLLE